MDTLERPGKSTGASPPTLTDAGAGKAPLQSSDGKKVLPQSNNVPLEDVSNNSTPVPSAFLLAIMILAGDFPALKTEAPESWQVSKDGKIYWCASLPGHVLSVEGGNLLVDGEKASDLLANLLAEAGKK